MAARKSGFHLGPADMPIVLGMIARNDRRHDIAAWFGVNQGRVKDAENGRWGKPAAAPKSALPPTGAPGIKGRRLREGAEDVMALLGKGDAVGAKKRLADLLAQYDANEP